MNVHPGRRTRFVTVALLMASAILAFILRSLPWRNYLDGDNRHILFGPDSYDHLRRITLGIEAFPNLPPYDFYYGFPKGTGQIWAPLFDYLIAALALLIGRGSPTPETVTTLAFWLPPLLAAATVYGAYAIGKRLFGPREGIVAALVIALLPAHILYSFVSRLDHHVAEPLICLAIMSSLLAGMERKDTDATLCAPAVTAFWMVFALLIWRGSVIFWGIVFVALLLQVLATGPGSDRSRPAGIFALRLHLFAALMLVPFCALNLWGTAGGLTSGIVSWFHVLLLTACGLLFFALNQLRRGRTGLFLAMLPVAAGIAFLLVPTGRSFLREFLGGIEIITGDDPWLASISELISILRYQSGALDLWFPAENFSLLYWLFPLLIALLVHRWRQGGWQEFRYPLFIVWGGLFWFLPLFRFRYCHLTALTIALGCGLLFTTLTDHTSGTGNQRSRTVAVALFLLFLLMPTVSLLRTIPSTSPERAVMYDLMVALKWMKDTTPKTSFYSRPDRPPEYGVLADWGLGAHIVNIAERPTLATNFGWETHGLYESAAFQALGDPASAAEILDSNRVRYILLNQVIGTLEDDRAIASYGFRRGKLPRTAASPFALQRSMYYRLLGRDGGAYEAMGSSFAALGRYRLIYESFNTVPYPGVGIVSLFKIFEYLPGAVITGAGLGGERAELEIRLNSPIGRTLAYRDWTTVGKDGRFTFRVPYPTTVASGILTPLGGYDIRIGGRQLHARVTEDEVYGGRVVNLP